MTKLDTLKKQTADLEAKLKQQVEEAAAKLEEMKAEIDRLENGWEMKCPFKKGDVYFTTNFGGGTLKTVWEFDSVDKHKFSQGDIFETEQAAELESKRRNLLTRFRAFRDECNGDWKADWSDYDKKWSISKDKDGLFDTWTMGINTFVTFGYFKNKKDAQRAIELFGGEIKELFVEGDANENN